MRDLSADDSVEFLYHHLYSAIDSFVPKYVKSHFANTYPVWFTPELMQLVRNKKAAHIKYKKSSLLCDYIHFSYLRSECKRASAMCYQQYCKRLECNINSDVKVFWNIANSNASSSTIPTEMKYGNDSANSGEHVANLFSGYFESVYITSVASFTSSVQYGCVDVNSIWIKIARYLIKSLA